MQGMDKTMLTTELIFFLSHLTDIFAWTVLLYTWREIDV